MRGRAASAGIAVALVLLSAVPSPAAAAEPGTVFPTPPDPPTVMRPGQAPIPGQPPADRDPKFALPAPRPDRESRDRIVYAFDRPWREVLEYEAELTDKCRRGRFLQRLDMFYRAFGPGERPLGVAYGRSAINLIDPDRLRREDTVYFFDKQETGRCTVYTAQVEEVRPWFVGP